MRKLFVVLAAAAALFLILVTPGFAQAPAPPIPPDVADDFPPDGDPITPDAGPIEPVQPDVEPDTPSFATRVSIAVQSVIDAQETHDGSLAAILSAEDAERVAETAYETAREHTANVRAETATSSATVVERARAAISELEALIASHVVPE